MQEISTKVLIIKPKDKILISEVFIKQKCSLDVKIKWSVSTVCNSERRRFNLTKSHYDKNAFIGGHEAIGVLVNEYNIQEIYALMPHSNCLTRNEEIKCPACLSHNENLCTRMRHAGLDADTPSGFAKQMFVPKNQLYDVSDVDIELAPFLEPLACVVRSWGRIGFEYSSGENIINIIGGGPIGCLHAFYINKINKKNRINIVEIDPKRRNVLKEIYRDVKNISIVDNSYKSLSDVSVMAASNSDAYIRTVNLTKKDGTVMLFSGFNDLSFEFSV